VLVVPGMNAEDPSSVHVIQIQVLLMRYIIPFICPDFIAPVLCSDEYSSIVVALGLKLRYIKQKAVKGSCISVNNVMRVGYESVSVNGIRDKTVLNKLPVVVCDYIHIRAGVEAARMEIVTTWVRLLIMVSELAFRIFYFHAIAA